MVNALRITSINSMIVDYSMKTKFPSSAHQETNGIVHFARMLDKIRLNAGGDLPPGYFLGTADPTFFDARLVKFLGVDYEKIVRRTLEGGSNGEILEWCFQNGRKPSNEEILVWNQFLLKRGWRDESSGSLQSDKEKMGFGARSDIQTWVDLQDVDEGQKPEDS
jgi:Domain of unknown function (DUF5069)